jgi:UDP-N-acetylglucosamine acyltransferase
MVGMSTSLTQDVPPFVILSGNPAAAHGINSEGLKRRGFSPEEIAAIRRCYKLIYKSGFTLEEAKTALRKEEQDSPLISQHVQQMREFIEHTTRGIVR